MIERTYHCDGPDCERSWGESAQRQLGEPRVSWGGKRLNFCGWDCILRYGATIPPEEIIPWPSPGDDAEPTRGP